MEFAFEQLQIRRVGFSIDKANIQSGKALEKLTIQREGELRNYLIRADGNSQDSLIYSVIEPEWPSVKKHITELIKGSDLHMQAKA